MTDYEVIKTSDDGQYRVVLTQDTDCEQPMDSGDWWTTSVLTRTSRGFYRYESDPMEAMYDPQGRLDAWRHFADWRVHDAVSDADEAFKRYMRIFHCIEVFDVTIHNGYRDTSNALAWLEPSERERVGFSDQFPAKDAIDMEIGEHNRWADGECYGYIVQKRVKWSTDDPEFEDREDWEDTDDSLWGLIGYEYAEQQATEALAITST